MILKHVTKKTTICPYFCEKNISPLVRYVWLFYVDRNDVHGLLLIFFFEKNCGQLLVDMKLGFCSTFKF